MKTEIKTDGFMGTAIGVLLKKELLVCLEQSAYNLYKGACLLKGMPRSLKRKSLVRWGTERKRGNQNV